MWGSIVTVITSLGVLLGTGIMYLASDTPRWFFALCLLGWAALTACLIWHTFRWPQVPGPPRPCTAWTGKASRSRAA